jgi:hypothetical protein
MKQLDDLLVKIYRLYTPIFVKGKEYPGSNPYILNKINNMLHAGRIKNKYGDLTSPVETLSPDDLRWDSPKLQFQGEREYVVYDELNKISDNIFDEANSLSDEEAQRLARENS